MSNILLIGAGGFIGTNLSLFLLSNTDSKVYLVDSNISFFSQKIINDSRAKIVISQFNQQSDFDLLTKNMDYVIHLASTNIPATKNGSMDEEINSNVRPTISLLDACVKNKIKKVLFVSSGGAVYGKNVQCPIPETSLTDPISPYGLQKLIIEKLLYLYHHLYGLNYIVTRLANPYGPYQRPNSGLGMLTTLVYKSLNKESINLYGDGSVKRDFIYIYDAVEAISNLLLSDVNNEIFNIGSGQGTSIKDLIGIVEKEMNYHFTINRFPSRINDVPENYLDIQKYSHLFPGHSLIPLHIGINKTRQFFTDNLDDYNI
jgi:UDP-glucose 4-epimerase